MSHESHNHPSQIVPYEGAATGVGGNVRDVCCMGAEVIAVADGLRFGEISRQKTSWIQENVVAGIAGYGNPIGVPNLAGDVYFDPGYNENCLVTVVTLGIVRDDHVIHSYAPEQAEDYVFILVGKPTDNSGFGGASFASTELIEEHQEQNKGAVQEPNAFLKRHLLKANYALFEILREKNLIHRVGFKDLGAGGVACASVELAEAGGYGAEIDLEKVPTSMTHLHPSVILCSETQERFMWVVPKDLVDLILTHYNQTFALPDIFFTCD
jgi:phosphoribosylformylglycinamidine (FGAM) synthase-like enzyme